MSAERFKMVDECTNSYSVDEQSDGGVIITIKVPKRFSDLWIIKLSELEASEAELEDPSK